MMRQGRSRRWPLHVTLAFGLALCAVGFTVELRRGLGGHLPAWVYVVEWPFFGAVGFVLWRRLVAEVDARDAERSGTAPAPNLAPRRSAPASGDVAPDDPDLLAWQAYVATLDSAPPSGPPATRED